LYSFLSFLSFYYIFYNKYLLNASLLCISSRFDRYTLLITCLWNLTSNFFESSELIYLSTSRIVFRLFFEDASTLFISF